MGNGTSIGRVRGLGSAKAGTHHWLLQRWTAIGNFVLVAYLAVSLLLLPNLGYQAVSGWIANPIPAAAIALLIVSTFWHARLGLQVPIEDYVHGGNRLAVMIALNLVAFAGAAFGLLSIIRLALGGA
ncbi:MAG: succinate dehydrogenase, hydrophobic membrane anchor protein [Alphaproteobacteria bacterium]|nr:succinate dehydrogenase, hydrophobic membrane anchor protein [Alphaproteobacteria bacterium]